MKITAIIPARMGATRFPGKPLAKINGLEMIEHIRRRVELNNNLNKVIVATCDKEIQDVVIGNGGLSVMTSSTHERCTDRVAEAAKKIDADIIINVQGDEPQVNPFLLDELIKPFRNNPDTICTNLLGIIQSDEEFQTVNEVKAVIDQNKRILYFSREPIPSKKKAIDTNYIKYKQLGLIAFSKKFLMEFNTLPQTPLEAVESVDMLRAIEHGFDIQGVITTERTISVDTAKELLQAEQLLMKDSLTHLYM